MEEVKMSMKRFQELSEKRLEKELCGLVLKEGEKKLLYKLCVKYGVQISYPILFADDTHYYLWGISKKGIGLVGTVVMKYLSENNGTIFCSLDELEEYLIHLIE